MVWCSWTSGDGPVTLPRGCQQPQAGMTCEQVQLNSQRCCLAQKTVQQARPQTITDAHQYRPSTSHLQERKRYSKNTARTIRVRANAADRAVSRRPRRQRHKQVPCLPCICVCNKGLAVTSEREAGREGCSGKSGEETQYSSTLLYLAILQC